MRNYKTYVGIITLFILIEIVATCVSFSSYHRLLSKKDVLGTEEKAVQETVSLDTPQKIIIPAIGLYAATKQVGIAPDGALDVPGNVEETGWYKLGPRPGDIGSAVITGHYDTAQGKLGVFGKLHLLQVGDKIYIENTKGNFLSFTVRESRRYVPNEDASAVFGQKNGIHLNLITCDGTWNQTQRSYTERLVIFADATK